MSCMSTHLHAKCIRSPTSALSFETFVTLLSDPKESVTQCSYSEQTQDTPTANDDMHMLDETTRKPNVLARALPQKERYTSPIPRVLLAPRTTHTSTLRQRDPCEVERTAHRKAV